LQLGLARLLMFFFSNIFACTWLCRRNFLNSVFKAFVFLIKLFKLAGFFIKFFLLCFQGIFNCLQLCLEWLNLFIDLFHLLLTGSFLLLRSFKLLILIRYPFVRLLYLFLKFGDLSFQLLDLLSSVLLGLLRLFATNGWLSLFRAQHVLDLLLKLLNVGFFLLQVLY